LKWKRRRIVLLFRRWLFRQVTIIEILFLFYSYQGRIIHTYYWFFFIWFLYLWTNSRFKFKLLFFKIQFLLSHPLSTRNVFYIYKLFFFIFINFGSHFIEIQNIGIKVWLLSIYLLVIHRYHCNILIILKYFASFHINALAFCRFK